MLIILDTVIPQTSITLLRSHYKQLSSTLMKIAKNATQYPKIIRLCLSALGSSMILQDTSDGFWGALHSLQSVNALLAFIDDSRVKLRKTVHDKLIDLIQCHKKKGAKSVRSYIADFCLSVLKVCTRSEYKRSLCVVLFLEHASPFLIEDQAVQIMIAALRVQSCNQPVLTASMFRMLDNFFQSSFLSLNAEQTSLCIKNLIDMRPDASDMEGNTYFCTALASGIVYLHKKSPPASYSLLDSSIAVLIDGCNAEFTQIHCAVATALKRIISQCFDEDITRSALEASTKKHQDHSLISAISSISDMCQMRYKHTWLYVMSAIRALFDKFKGNESSQLLNSLIMKLSDIYQAIDKGVIQVEPGVFVILEDTIGASLQSCGVVNFLTLMPLRAPQTPKHFGIDESRQWLLKIMHANLKHMPCNLADFGNQILSAAIECNKAVQSPEQYSITEPQAQILRNRVLQLWSLFPGFCYCRPLDIVQSISRMMSVVDGVLKDTNYPELHPYVITGLTHLANGARERCVGTIDTPEISALKIHAQAFMQTMLAVLENMDVRDAQFQSCIQCISAWSSIAPPKLLSSISKKLLELLLTSTGSADDNDATIAAGWMAVVQAIIPFLPNNMIVILFRTVRPLLTVDTSATLQKRAYHVLDTLLRKHGDILFATEARLDILAVVSDSLLTCHVSARTMRLRCMQALMETMTTDDIAEASSKILGEVLICQKDSNKKCRDSAMDLIKTIVANLSPMQMLTHLCSAIVGETAYMRSSAIIGLCVLIFEHREDEELLVNVADLLPTICLLLKEQCSEMSRAVLSFLRVCSAVLPINILMPVLPILVTSFTEGLGSQKAKFSTRARAIMRKLEQRLGDQVLRPLVPESDLALLGYVEKLSRRAQRRKDKKIKAEDKMERMLGSDSDSSSDEEDMNGDSRGKKVSVLDPRLANRPKAIRAKDIIDSMPSTLSDLLEDQPQFSSQVTHAKASKMDTDQASDEDEDYKVTITADGRVVIREKDDVSTQAVDHEGIIKTKSKKPNDGTEEKKSDRKGKRQREPGEEYRSKNAGGDVWKRGMLEPHAFIPLDPRMLSKKHHSEAVSHFGAVVDRNKKQKVSASKSRGLTGNRKQRESRRKHQSK
jgi:ribosomal RNA-processing protein 12